MSNNIAVQTLGVVKSFGRGDSAVRALKGVSLSLRPERISLALAGWASSKWGPIPTIRFLAVVQLSWGALFLFLTRELRAESAGLEREDVQAPEPQPVR